MSEILDRKLRAKAHDTVYGTIIKHRRDIEVGSHALTDKVLSSPEIAVVDREAKCPQRPKLAEARPHYTGTRSDCYALGQADAQEKMIKEGWIREVPDD